MACRRGSAVVEFAFVAPIMALLVVGTMEFGMIMFSTTLMESGLRDAARFGITGAEPDGQSRLERILQIVDDRTLNLVDMDAAEIQILSYDTFETVGQGESVNVPSGRGIGDIGIIIPIGLRSHKGAGNAFCHGLSSSAWRFLTRILAPT